MDVIGQLLPLAPYDFDLCVNLLWLHGVLDIARAGEYWRALAIDGETALVRVVNSGSVEQPQLTLYRAASTGPVADDDLLHLAGQMLNVNLDMEPFYDQARRDAELWSVVEPLVGFRPVRAASLFEALITAIIEQQIALKLAKRAEHWLMRWADNHIDYADKRYYTFPRPDQLAKATVDDLLPLKITRQRMRVMIDSAQQVQMGAIPFSVEADHSPDEILQTLLQIKGVGPWTATWAVIRAMGIPIAGAENDVALQAAINHYFYGESGRAAPQQVTAILQRYGEFAGAAAFHILMRWATDQYSPEAAE